MPTNKNYYDVLGVDRNATADEIKQAYRRLARIYHPKPDPDAEAKMKEINEAYGVLGDPLKRAEYDKKFRPAQPKPQTSSNGTKNYYAILGVKFGATDNQINAAYRNLLSNCRDEYERANIEEAYLVLSDPRKRKQYDKKFRPAQTSPKGTKNYYAILGVKFGATQDAIKQAYLNLLNNRRDEYERANIEEAYSVLGDPLKRAGYDFLYPVIFRDAY